MDTPLGRPIADLRLPDRDDRLYALNYLYRRLYEQGFALPEAAEAVPLLLAVAADPSVPDRHRILQLVGNVASEDGTIGAGPVCEALLADPEAPVRTAAAYVLAHLADPPAERLALVRAAMSAETDGRAKASLALCLGQLGQAADRALLRALLQHQDESVRVAAAIAEVALGAAPDDELIAVLGRGLVLPLEREEVLYEHRVSALFPWSSLANRAARALARLGKERPVPIIEALTEGIRARLAAGQRLETPMDRTGEVVFGDEPW